MGEPWLTRLHADELAAKLRSMGFLRVVHLTPEEARRRYFRDHPVNTLLLLLRIDGVAQESYKKGESESILASSLASRGIGRSIDRGIGGRAIELRKTLNRVLTS